MFEDEELIDIFRLLAAILHLGNLKFEGKFDMIIMKKKKTFLNLATTTQNMDTCVVSNSNILRTVSKLLKVIDIRTLQKYMFCFIQIDENGLSNGFLKRTILAHGEAVVTPLSREQAFDVRYDFFFFVMSKYYVSSISVMRSLKEFMAKCLYGLSIRLIQLYSNLKNKQPIEKGNYLQQKEYV